MTFSALFNRPPLFKEDRGAAKLTLMLLVSLLLGACNDSVSTEKPGPAIVISDAWVRDVPPQAKMTAAYLKMSNRGDNVRQITAVSSPAFGSVTLHQTTMTDGVMRMRPAEDVTIEPGGTLSFEPGGLHVMLGMRRDGFVASEPVELLFRFANGNTVSTFATIQAQSAE